MTLYHTLFPGNVWDCWWLAPLALVLDLWLGDPELPWRHPVCLLGRVLDWLEGPARRFMLGAAAAAAPAGRPVQGAGHRAEPEAERGAEQQQTELQQAGQKWRGRLAGALALLVLLLLTGLVVRGLLALPWVGPILALYLAWAGLAMKSLLDTGREVLTRLEGLPEAEGRKALSWLVSRDTSRMDRPLMRKTLADTLSENFTDALLVPYFWLLVLGPVGLWLYKAVSTTDSMWGYRTERWQWLGWAGARSDDALAFVPARLSILVLWATDVLFRRTGLRGRVWQGRWPGCAVVARQAAGMPSPNSGWPMTACAWLCGARMAGPSVYFGTLVSKPWLGPPEEEARHWDRESLLALCTLMYYAAQLGGFLLWLACCAPVALF